MSSSTIKKQRTVLVLYTELAPYVLACLNAFVEHSKVKVELVRWPVNPEAPFELSFHPAITVHERRNLEDVGLVALAERTAPDLVFASGWVDKGYLKVCRAMRKKGVPTVMTFDTAWRGGAKQAISAALGRLWVPSTFSHAWATGEQQARYARNLGFKNDRIRKGFYAADTKPFLNVSDRERKNRSTRFQHRFICVARYISTKGQQELCDAFAALADSGLAGDWELHLVGTGAMFEDVRDSPSGKHPKITHHGFIQAQAMPAFLKAGGVSVLPSLYEPWGVVVQEFACMGLPLLLSDAVGARERFLVEGENGYVHKAGNVVDLQRSLERTVQHSDTELSAMGARSAELGAAWTPEHWAEVAGQLLNERS
ncbi:MAG: glycosyltransferase family 4 protein [Flavobacteriales bacterium]|nr:glycosyltransferase family 4 protein [Flavobacteriales bacterium]